MKEMSLKRKGIRSLLGAVLCLVMGLTILPTTAFAAGQGQTQSNPYVVDTFEQFNSAMKDSSITYIKVKNDLAAEYNGSDALNKYTIAVTGNKVVDMNGCKVHLTIAKQLNDYGLASFIVVQEGGDLSFNGGGTISYINRDGATRNGCGTIRVSGGTLTVNGTSVENGAAGSAILLSSGDVTLDKAATVIGGDGFAVCAQSNAKGSVNINDATIVLPGAKSGHTAGYYSAMGNSGYGALALLGPNVELSVKKAVFYGLVAVNTAEQTGAINVSDSQVLANGKKLNSTDVVWTTRSAFNTYLLASGENVSQFYTRVAVFPESNPIYVDALHVNVTEPVAGEAPSDDAFVDSPSASITKVEWKDLDHGYYVNSLYPFEAGVTYECALYINSVIQISSPLCTINGENAERITSNSPFQIVIYKAFTVTGSSSDKIENVAVEVTAPVVGKAPVATGTTSTENVTVTKVEWKDVAGGYYIYGDNYPFEAGKKYLCEVYLATDKEFSSSMSATINGNAATVTGGGAQATVTYTFEATENHVVTVGKLEYEISTGTNGLEAMLVGPKDNFPENVIIRNDVECDGKVIPVTKIQDTLFRANKNIVTVYIGDNITEIETMAFPGCSNLQEVRFPDNLKVTSVGLGMFTQCTSLKKVNIPASWEYIPRFCARPSLEEVVIPAGVKKIEEKAFYNCTSLKKIEFGGTQKQWETLISAENCGEGNDALKDPNLVVEFKHVHSGGKATCTKKAVCTECGEEYGSLASHEYATTWTTDGTNHWHECTVCGKKKDKAAHTLKTTTTKATLTENGKKETKCTVCENVTKTTKIYAAKTIKLSKTAYTYDGKAKKPTVTIKDSKGKAIATSNYTVKYDDGRKNVGKYNVKITFKGDYKGSKTLTFTINPKATTLKSVTPASKAFTATWSKQTTQVDGYELEYALDKNFTSSAKKVAVTKNTTTSKKISSLKSKKTYYVRVRTYKKVGTEKYYSDWSKVLNVKTK